jgi:hypothetical protein
MTTLQGPLGLRQRICVRATPPFLLSARGGRVTVISMSERDVVKTIVTPFLVHGICKTEAEALGMLARDYAQRQVTRYAERVAQFRSMYKTSLDQFADQVRALCGARGEIVALAHLPKAAQIVQAEDDLEEWEAAERFLARWQAVETDLRNAAAA